MQLSFFGISFHAYGFIIGMSLVIALWLIEKKAKQINFKPYTNEYSESILWWFTAGGLIGGIFGARIWHVVTDFYLYKDSLIKSIYIWNGGMSILGGILGGYFGILIVASILNKKYYKKNKLINKTNKTVLDLVVFGLPFAQAVGRFANYVNQELYGLPTNLPWGIIIDDLNRIPGFEQYSKYHPLFLYESILMLIFGVFVWILETKQKTKWRIGSGRFIALYILYYSGVRFLLEFLRIDKTMFSYFGGDIIGVNQIVLLLVFIGMSIWWIYHLFIKKESSSIKNNQK